MAWPWLRKLRRQTMSRGGLWLLLAGLLASHHLLLSLVTQGAEEAVNALLVWGGACVVLDERPMGWRPRPGRIGAVAGTVLVLAVLWRSQQITSLDSVSSLLPLIAGLALALLAAPARRLAPYRQALLMLALLPVMRSLMVLIPTVELSLVTARVTQVLLVLCGLPVQVTGNVVQLPEGAVEIMGPCSGIGMVVQLIGVGLIFALAFPMRHRWQSAAMLLVAPLLAVLANGARIALLAMITASSMAARGWWFNFFHEAEGSLVFSGVAVLVFAWLYGLWMEWQIRQLEAAR